MAQVARPSHGAYGVGLTANEAMRNAESLLEQKTISEIKEIELKTRQDIEMKKNQLRQLVGDSYRDLIASADTIANMANVCEQIVQNIDAIQASFTDLASNIENSKSDTLAKAESAKHEELYAVGSRVKYLVDTSEMIWGCLDSSEYLQAAHRFLRAREVHKLLSTVASKQVMHQFPLLRHHWPLVIKFQDQIAELAMQALSDNADPNATRVADAIVAIAFLRDLDSQQCLDLLLSTRQQWLTTHIHAAASSPDVATATTMLSQALTAVQNTVAQVGDLFLQQPMEQQLPLVAAMAAGDGVSSSELLFGPLPTDASNVVTEVAAWEQCIHTLRQRLAVLPPDHVADTTRQWLQGLSDACMSDIQQSLQHCVTAAQLVELEQMVVGEQAAWRWSSVVGMHSKSTVSRIRHADSAPQLQGSSLAPSTYSWEDICTWVLGVSRYNTWDVLMEGAFMSCVQQRIDGWMEGVARAVLEPMTTCFEAVQAQGDAHIGSYRPSHWPDTNPASTTNNTKTDTKPTSNWRNQVGSIHSAMDTQLLDMLRGVLLILDSKGDGGGPGDPRGGGAVHRRAQAREGRAARVQPYVQQCCTTLIERIAQGLSTLLTESTFTTPAAAVEPSLCVATLAAALAHRQGALHVVLGPPDAWRDALPHQERGESPDGPRGGRLRPPPSRAADPAQQGPLTRLQERLQDDESIGEMRFTLPANASAATVHALVTTCSELARAGGHTLNPSVVRLLRDQVAGAVVEGLMGAVQPGQVLRKRLSEKGILQLLFDVRLLHDVLAPTPPTTAPRGTPHPPSGPQWGALESQLAGELDPIDWATYESHVWANEGRYYQRCHVLFGNLIQLQRLHGDITIKVSSAAIDTNIMTVAPPCARFSYLPISTPTAAAAAAPLVTPLSSSTPSDYSFASFGGARGAGSKTAEEQSTLESLQTRFAPQRFGALSSLLGDKAAEVTALAQQSLGETLTNTGFFSTMMSKSFTSSSGGT